MIDILSQYKGTKDKTKEQSRVLFMIVQELQEELAMLKEDHKELYREFEALSFAVTAKQGTY